MYPTKSPPAWIPLLLLAATAAAQNQVAVVVSPHATAIEKLAAAELTTHLQLLYPSASFLVRDQPPSGMTILLGTPATFPALARDLTDRKPAGPESFVVATPAGNRAVIAGADPPATLHAVYSLLENLGFGFYLSYTTQPPPCRTPLTFDGWNLADSPLAATRLVFNWHNFLSGCSTWSLADWQNWIARSSRMRFNTIMVHAYGNNPMFSFTHNGLRKPTGFLSTTARGRDWGTQHVLDVRTIIGASGLFQGPVFGSPAALVPEAETVPAATALMQQVFQSAAARGMGITFALDVDTESANPQNIVATLPPSARFTVRGFQLPNPDTPEGRAYYRSQVQQLLETYPQITRLAIWFRGGRNSPWRELTPADFPPAWRDQYTRAIQSKRSLRADPDAPSLFAIARIAAAFRAALDETGHRSVTLAAGSWKFEFLRAADAFFPPGVALIPLDYDYAFPSDSVQETVRAVTVHRPVIPIVWAQHDDRGYIGRPYLPFPGFASLLRRTASAGYGIIHWTTRPLDLYFKNLSAQVWHAAENETLDTTCARMAQDTFGPAARDAGRQYLLSWIQDAPMFGRETRDRMIDQRLDAEPVLAGCRQRLQYLEQVKPLAKSPQAAAWVNYYQDWENFVMDFFRAQGQLLDADARAAIEQYARTIAHGGATPGEKGILISLNLRWLPYMLVQDPIRIRFAPTAAEPLAQSPGKNTFAFDSEYHLWHVLGATETGGDVTADGLNVDHEIVLSLDLPPTHREVKLDLTPGSAIGVEIERGNLTLRPTKPGRLRSIVLQ